MHVHDMSVKPEEGMWKNTTERERWRREGDILAEDRPKLERELVSSLLPETNNVISSIFHREQMDDAVYAMGCNILQTDDDDCQARGYYTQTRR